MNNREAQFLLSAYRPGGADAQDPAFAEALAQARADAALAAWWGRSAAFDQHVAARLRAVEPPPGLREAILAGGRVSSTGTIGRVRPIWSYGWLAAAAVLALAFGLAVLLRPRTVPISPAELAGFALADLHAPGHAGDPDAASAAALATVAAPMEKAALPIDFARMEADGCRSLTFGRRKVIEVCFRNRGLEYHLYVLRRSGAAEAPSDSDRALTEVQDAGGAAASWVSGNYVYALAAHSADALRRLL